jgi:F0F1-type ATP synthase membrane subunit b/b'
MEHHTLSTWQIILESNILNFVLFLGLVLWFAGKSIPALIKQRNEEIASQLRKAHERARLAEEQLALAEKELASFKNNLEQMKQESESRIKSLKEDLALERERKRKSLNAKYEREIEAIKLSIKQEVEALVAQKAFVLAEEILKSKAKNHPEFNQNFLQETLKLINLQPELLKN